MILYYPELASLPGCSLASTLFSFNVPPPEPLYWTSIAAAFSFLAGLSVEIPKTALFSTFFLPSVCGIASVPVTEPCLVFFFGAFRIFQPSRSLPLQPLSLKTSRALSTRVQT